jgi:hypothetical protein
MVNLTRVIVKKFQLQIALKETTNNPGEQARGLWRGGRMLDAKEKVAGFHPKGGNMGGVVTALKMNYNILSSSECGQRNTIWAMW